MLRARVQSSTASVDGTIPGSGERGIRCRRIQTTDRSAAAVTNRPSCRLLASRNTAEISAMLRSRVTNRRRRRRRRRFNDVECRVAPMQPADPATLPVTFIVHLLGSFFSFRSSLTFLVPLLRTASERVAR